MPLEIIPKRDTKWKKITCEEANELIKKKDSVVIWWRPNMQMYSQDTPEQDPVWVSEE